MSLRLPAVAAAAVVLVAASWGSPQGLGSVAAREKAKRAKSRTAKPEGVPSYTDADLDSNRPSGSKEKGEPAVPAEYSPAPSEGSGREGGGSAAREGGEREAGERQRQEDAQREARDQVAAAEARLAELRDKLNPMSGSFIYGAGGSNSPNEEAEVRAGLTAAEAALAEAREGLARAEKGGGGPASAEVPH